MFKNLINIFYFFKNLNFNYKNPLNEAFYKSGLIKNKKIVVFLKISD